MFDPTGILRRARDAGLRLWPDGDRIAISPARLCPPDLLASIRAAKPQILELLAAERSLLPDELLWLPVARQVLAGEFDGGIRSELEAVWYGVRTIHHPVCRDASTRLETLLGHNRKGAPR